MAQPKVKADLPIEALLKEKRKFPPSKAFVKNAVMNKKAIYAEAARNPVKFWEQRARELHWFKPWKKRSSGSRRTPSGSSRQAQRGLQLPRSPCGRAAQDEGRPDLGG